MLNVVLPSLGDVLDHLRRHPAITRVEQPESNEAGGYRIVAEVTVELPSRAKAQGISATGVLAREPVIFDFGKDWPILAPVIKLRKDFPSNLPHINPFKKGDFVPPCIYAGSTTELMHREGFESLIDQTVEWLCKAAGNHLIDENQGWEPTRRDNAPDTMAFDAERIVDLLPTDGSAIQLPSLYSCLNGHTNVLVKLERLEGRAYPFTQESRQDYFGRGAYGKTRTFLVAPKHQLPEGHAPVNDTYEPETVTSLNDLFEKAQRLGIDDVALLRDLQSFLSSSQTGGKTFSWPEGFVIGVIFAIRRPFPLISGFGRSIEFLPYLIRHTPLPGKKSVQYARVEPAIHQQTVSPRVLCQVSGTSKHNTAQSLVWLGGGSLGSKVALHLAKEGYGKQTFIDDDVFSPHNVARHALTSRPEFIEFPYKAFLMTSALRELGHDEANGALNDAVSVLRTPAEFKELIADDSVIVDTTASLKVMESACASPLLAQFGGRYVRAAMMGQGKVCFAAAEGPQRGARIDDLMSLLYVQCRRDDVLRKHMSSGTARPEQLYVGQNCSSATMLLPDTRVSRAAAAISIQLERWLQEGLPVIGTLAVGVEDELGIGLTWNTIVLEPTTVLQIPDGGGWEVRVLSEAVRAIETEVSRWRPIETGGALVGHVYPGRRCVVIADVVDAPNDSQRSPTRFMLGTEELEEKLKQAHQSTLGYLHFVGTWHSHPTGGGLSVTDRTTLRNLAQGAQGLPAISLVWTPRGFICEVLTINE